MAYPHDRMARTKRIAREWALRDVSFALESGSILGIVGPNGAGKTTLLRLAAGLLLPTSGEVVAYGSRQTALGCHYNNVALVLSDDRSFSWRLTVRQNLRLFAALEAVSKSERNSMIGYLVELFGLNEAFDLPVGQLSTGMRQKLAICRALLSSPQLLLLDEPTKGLDPPTTASVLEFFRSELNRRRHMSIVMIAHDIDHVKSICDSALVLVNGSVRTLGQPGRLEEILTSSVSVEIFEKSDSHTELVEQLIAIDNVHYSRTCNSTVATVDSRNTHGLARLFATIDTHRCAIRSVSVQRTIAWPETEPDCGGIQQSEIMSRAALASPATTPRKQHRTKSTAATFLSRCLAIVRAEIEEALSYRFARLLSVIISLILISGVIVGTKCLKIGQVQVSNGHTAAYLAFLITGFIGSSATLGVMRGIPQRLRKHQVQGTLEALLASGCPIMCLATAFCGLELAPPLVATCTTVWIASTIGARLAVRGLTISIVVLLIGIPSFFGIALTSVAFCLTRKKGDPIAALLSLGFFLAAGVVFPISSAPAALHSFANMLPLSLVVEGVRRAALTGAKVASLVAIVVPLMLYDLVFVLIGVGAVRRAVDKAAFEGTLVQY